MKSNIAKLLREKRLKKKYTLKYVAEKIGYGQLQFLSNNERGASLPPPKHWKRICKVLDISRPEMASALIEDYHNFIWKHL